MRSMDSRHMRHCDMGRTQATALRSLLPFLATACLVTALTVPAFSSASAMVRSPASRGAPHRSGTAKILEFQDPSWTLKNLGSVWMSSPVVATIDGVKAVVLGTLSGEIYVVNAKSGRELPGWPQWVHINSPTPTAVDSSPAVAYLDGPDRPPSIIVGAGSLWRPDQQGGLEAFYASGRVRFVFQTRRTFNPWARTAPDDYSDPVFATPAVGDITGTGELDIVFGSYDHNIYALRPNGSLVPGFPIQRADTIWSSPTLADTSHTGRDDIIMGGDSSGFEGCRGGWIVDYRYVAAGPKLVWQRCTQETIWSSPTVGILNGTGRPAVVVGTSFYHGKLNPASNEIIAVYADNGRNVPGWPVTAHGPTFGSPAIGLVDGQLAVVSTSCAQCIKGPAAVSAWSGSGHEIWSRVFDAHNEATSSPVLVGPHRWGQRRRRCAGRCSTGAVRARGEHREGPLNLRRQAARPRAGLRHTRQRCRRLCARRSGKRLDAVLRLRRADHTGNDGRVPISERTGHDQPAGMARMEGERGSNRDRRPALGAANFMCSGQWRERRVSPRDK